MNAVEEAPQQATIQSRPTFGEQMREFPWWAIIMVVALLAAFLAMLTNPTYRSALSFIVNPPVETEIAFGLAIVDGLRMTLFVTVVSYSIALVLGLIVGIMRVSRNPILFHLSTLYVELMRGVPLLVLIIWIGFVVLPYLREASGGKITLSPVQGAIIGLGMGYAAYLAEVYLVREQKVVGVQTTPLVISKIGFGRSAPTQGACLWHFYPIANPMKLFTTSS